MPFGTKTFWEGNLGGDITSTKMENCVVFVCMLFKVDDHNNWEFDEIHSSLRHYVESKVVIIVPLLYKISFHDLAYHWFRV